MGATAPYIVVRVDEPVHGVQVLPESAVINKPLRFELLGCDHTTITLDPDGDMAIPVRYQVETGLDVPVETGYLIAQELPLSIVVKIPPDEPLPEPMVA